MKPGEKEIPTKEGDDFGDTLAPSTRKQRNWDDISGNGKRENGGSRLGGESGRRRRNLLDQAAEVLGEKNGQECSAGAKGEVEKEVRAQKRERILEKTTQELKECESGSGEIDQEKRRKERAARRKALLS